MTSATLAEPATQRVTGLRFNPIAQPGGEPDASGVITVGAIDIERAVYAAFFAVNELTAPTGSVVSVNLLRQHLHPVIHRPRHQLGFLCGHRSTNRRSRGASPCEALVTTAVDGVLRCGVHAGMLNDETLVADDAPVRPVLVLFRELRAEFDRDVLSYRPSAGEAGIHPSDSSLWVFGPREVMRITAADAWRGPNAIPVGGRINLAQLRRLFPQVPRIIRVEDLPARPRCTFDLPEVRGGERCNEPASAMLECPEFAGEPRCRDHHNRTVGKSTTTHWTTAVPYNGTGVRS